MSDASRQSGIAHSLSHEDVQRMARGYHIIINAFYYEIM